MEKLDQDPTNIQSIRYVYIGALAPSYLQSVPPVPITSLFQHLLGLGDVGGGDAVVVVEQAHSDVQEHQVHPVAEADLCTEEGGKKEKNF